MRSGFWRFASYSFNVKLELIVFNSAQYFMLKLDLRKKMTSITSGSYFFRQLEERERLKSNILALTEVCNWLREWD